MQCSAVILAGGESKRMGGDKAWVEFGGRPLVQLAVEKVRELGIKEIFTSGRAGEDYSALKCAVLFDLEPGFGPLGGIERGLHECASPLLLVLAVDLPQMSSAFLDRMQKTCNRLTGVIPKLNGMARVRKTGGQRPRSIFRPRRRPVVDRLAYGVSVRR